MTKSYSSHRFIANCFNAGNFKMVVKDVGDGISADEATVVNTLFACVALRDLELGKEIHGYVRDDIGFTMIIGNALLDMYCKCGCLDVTREIFDGLLNKNVICWTSMVSGYVSCGMLDEARRIAIDAVCGTALINMYAKCGCIVEEGWKHFELMKPVYQIEPKIEHYRCLIDLLGRAGLLKEAEKIVNRIPKEKDDIIVTVFGALLSICRLYGDVDMGEHLADRLMKIKVCDSSIHTLLANIYASVGRWEDVKKVRNASYPELKDVYLSLKTLAKLSSISGIYDVGVDNIVSINS
uniref:Pentatricopeptide repeat-containing protein At1g31430 n=1 Tax=Tanacetum cinerariifolium TaxID=118510 RepID=A0A6L2KHF6_TANCI|nr:pentatricopeptide repeat-containing protein At1g31430 [Tanacetum cinerariifolium]